MHNYDFDRQKPLDAYIVDFYCKELQLAIEIDGNSHDYKYEQDLIRQTRLESLGVHFLRFDDAEVKQNMSNVLRTISLWLENCMIT
jgi:very-short-patch-repair endonuclease